jgi:hypothetical protein
VKDIDCSGMGKKNPGSKGRELYGDKPPDKRWIAGNHIQECL